MTERQEVRVSAEHALAKWFGPDGTVERLELLRDTLSGPVQKATVQEAITELSKCRQQLATSEQRVRELEAALRRIDDWANAYPLEVFPEPDMKRVAEVLKAAGLTIDAVSASNMRHVLKGVLGIVSTVPKGEGVRST